MDKHVELMKGLVRLARHLIGFVQQMCVEYTASSFLSD